MAVINTPQLVYAAAVLDRVDHSHLCSQPVLLWAQVSAVRLILELVCRCGCAVLLRSVLCSVRVCVMCVCVCYDVCLVL